jgi:hypothetical protein
MQKSRQAGLAVFSHQSAGQVPGGFSATSFDHMVVKEGKKSSSCSNDTFNFQYEAAGGLVAGGGATVDSCTRRAEWSERQGI